MNLKQLNSPNAPLVTAPELTFENEFVSPAVSPNTVMSLLLATIAIVCLFVFPRMLQ